jgi:PPOX class probable F420-dependent enzyme
MTDDPIRLNQVTRAAVDSGRLVHLATINPDGTPQVICVYVGWDGDEIVAGHLSDHLKLRNIRRDPRVTLSVESDVQFEGVQPLPGDQGNRACRGRRSGRRAPQNH